MENGSWGVLSGKQIQEIIGSMKNMTVLDETVTVKSALKEDQLRFLIGGGMADAVVRTWMDGNTIRTHPRGRGGEGHDRGEKEETEK